jgi:UDP-glucuronate 4-epimerase
MTPVLVTGAAGFIGQHLGRALQVAGHQVWGVDLRPPPPTWDARYWIQGDLCEASLYQQFPPVSHVFHLAALAGVCPSLAHPEDYFRVNLGATAQLLTWLQTQPNPVLVFASSSAVYGDHPERPWHEGLRLQPISPYGASKAAAEAWIYSQCQQWGLRSAVVRPFSVYGPGQRPDMGFYRFAEALHLGQAITLRNPDSSRDYTYVSDVVSGMLKAYRWLLQQSPATWDCFNLGSQSPLALHQAYTLLAHLLQTTVPLHSAPLSPGEAVHTWSDGRRSAKILNYSPQVTFSEGLAAFSHWYLSRQGEGEL